MARQRSEKIRKQAMPTLQDWEQLALKELKTSDPDKLWRVNDTDIPVKALYTAKDLRDIGYEESYPGLSPFVRGPRASMYFNRPWTIRQYAGFSTAAESNRFYRESLASGQKGLSVAFDLATHRGYDSDHPRVAGDVGKAGVAIDSVEDMKRLFAGIPLKDVSVSMTMNGAVLPVLAAFIVAGEEQGVTQRQLRGTIQNDILKEYMVRNTYIFPPQPSMRIVGDVIEYCSQKLEQFNTVSISGYHMQEAGANAAIELAYTIGDGLEYVKLVTDRGIAVDSFAPRLSFFFGIGLNFLVEIAKLRAARYLWYHALQEFAPKNVKSSMLRVHCQTSGYSLTEQDPYNNVVRTTIEAMAAVLGGTQSLHTNALDEAIALPGEHSARIARNTQLILQEESDLTTTIDPFGGSYAMESLTHELIVKAKGLLAEVKDWGGMTKAIIAGIPKMRIEESSAKRQARIDSGAETIIGVNKYAVASNADDIDPLIIDNDAVMREQISGLEKLKQSRNASQVARALQRVENAARDTKSNLLQVSIEAMRVRATVGECTTALERVFGRHQSVTPSVSMVYGKQMQQSSHYQQALRKVEAFAKANGRRPRILVAKLGQDGHDRGAKVIAAGLSDLGFDVDIGPLFQSPKEAVKQAIDNDVHILGISSQAGSHRVLVPQLLLLLREQGAGDIRVVVGGVIPRIDYDNLKQLGVAAIFGPGSSIVDCAIELVDLIASDKKK